MSDDDVRHGRATCRSGTIKAPTFLGAARRVVARRLARPLGTAPAYLRLRAAGEDEMLVEVTAHPDGSGTRRRIVVVPPDTYEFAVSEDADALP